MAAQLRAVRARIRAVKSIAKITRAQELIASSRIIRAQQRTRAAEPYARELTQAGTVLGSPDYMAPEQARGFTDIDGRADIWALNIMLYEAITGRRPFDGPNYNALMMAIILEEPTPILSLALPACKAPECGRKNPRAA